MKLFGYMAPISMIAIVRILGLLLLVLGITFLIWGINETDTFSNRFLKEMANVYPEETKRYIFGGITMIVVGAGVLVASFFRKRR